jgi:hypothetical protein
VLRAGGAVEWRKSVCWAAARGKVVLQDGVKVPMSGVIAGVEVQLLHHEWPTSV